MESYKIKDKILKILDTDRNIIHTMVNNFTHQDLEKYESSDTYSFEYKKLQNIKDPFQKDIEKYKLISKGHWVFNFIEDYCISYQLFLTKDYDFISDDKIKHILISIILNISDYKNRMKAKDSDDSDNNRNTQSSVFTSINKNKPVKMKEKYIKTINSFMDMLNELHLGGEHKYYIERKEHYDINNDISKEIDFNELRYFLNYFKNNIKNINGDKNISSIIDDPFNIRKRFYYTSEYQLFDTLKNDLSNYCECSLSVISEFIEYLKYYLKNKVYNNQ